MEIRDTRTPPQHVAFSTRQPGDTFMSGANLFMRVHYQAGVDAVSLADGRMCLFSPADEVIPCKAYVVKET